MSPRWWGKRYHPSTLHNQPNTDGYPQIKLALKGLKGPLNNLQQHSGGKKMENIHIGRIASETGIAEMPGNSWEQRRRVEAINITHVDGTIMVPSSLL